MDGGPRLLRQRDGVPGFPVAFSTSARPAGENEEKSIVNCLVTEFSIRERPRTAPWGHPGSAPQAMAGSAWSHVNNGEARGQVVETEAGWTICIQTFSKRLRTLSVASFLGRFRVALAA